MGEEIIIGELTLTDNDECILVGRNMQCQIFINGELAYNFKMYKEMKDRIFGMTFEGEFKKIFLGECHFKSVSEYTFGL